MPNYTPNINLIKPFSTEFYSLNNLNVNSDRIDAAIGTANTNIAKIRDDFGFVTLLETSTANVKNFSIPSMNSYPLGCKLAFRNNITNTGNISLRINVFGARFLYRADGTHIPPGYLKANTIYHMVYDGTAFFLLGDAVEYGTAAASQVLSGYTFASPSGLANGTIPTKAAQTYTPGTSNKTINSGQYLGGVQTIEGDADLQASNIRYGKDIFGVNGLFSEDATARPGDVKYGEVFYHKGDRVVGTAPIVNHTVLVPKENNQSIQAGSYLAGNIDLPGDPNFLVHNIVNGVTLFGKTGTGPGFASGTAEMSNITYEYESWTTSGMTSFTARRASTFSLPFVPRIFIVVSRTMHNGVKPTTIYINDHEFYSGQDTPILCSGFDGANQSVKPVMINANIIIGNTVRLPILQPTGVTGIVFDWCAITY